MKNTLILAVALALAVAALSGCHKTEAQKNADGNAAADAAAAHAMDGWPSASQSATGNSGTPAASWGKPAAASTAAEARTH